MYCVGHKKWFQLDLLKSPKRFQRDSHLREHSFLKTISPLFLWNKTFLAVSIKLLQPTCIKLVERGKSESDNFWKIIPGGGKNVASTSADMNTQMSHKTTNKFKATIRSSDTWTTTTKWVWILSSASQHFQVSIFRGSRQDVWTQSCASSPIWRRWPSLWWSGGRRVLCAHGPYTSCTRWLGSSRSNGKGQQCDWFYCCGEVEDNM